MNVNGYETQTTFWQDFTIADHFGDSAIQDTFNRAFKEWKTNHIYLTELVLVLNWKCWYWYEHSNEQRSRLYQKLFYKTQDYALDHLKGAEFDYFFKITD